MTSPSDTPNPKMPIAVHASAVCVDGKAVVFLGPSTTGKSTICRLLSSREEPLEDDIVRFTRNSSGEWTVRNKNLTNQSVPLLAICRLYQAPIPHLERIEALQTCRYLVHAFFEVSPHKLLGASDKERIFADLTQIAQAIQGYHFYFDKSARTVEAFSAAFRLDPGCITKD